MTLQNIIELVNEKIAAVPTEDRNSRLGGKTTFLRTLVSSMLVESVEAKEILSKLNLCASISWQYGEPVPTLALCVSLNEEHPYRLLSSKVSVSFSLMKFARRKKKISATREALVIDHAELSESMAMQATIDDIYSNSFQQIKNGCQEVIQAVKKIDTLLSLAGRDAVIDAFSAADALKSISGLNMHWYKHYHNNNSVFNDDLRKKILSMEE